VLGRVKATGVPCHNRSFTCPRRRPGGSVSRLLGHEARARIRHRKASQRQEGYHVHSLYTPECRQCPSCRSRRPISARDPCHSGPGPEPRRHFGVSRRRSHPHYMGTSPLRLHRAAEIAWRRSARNVPFDKVCYIGCCVTTGIAPCSTRQCLQGARQSCSGSAASASTSPGACGWPCRHDHRWRHQHAASVGRERSA